MSTCNERSGSHGTHAAAAMMNEPDFHLSHYGTFSILTPVSAEGIHWLDAYFSNFMLYPISIRTLLLDLRYLTYILEHIKAAALVVRII
jgi:hypothetical protein